MKKLIAVLAMSTSIFCATAPAQASQEALAVSIFNSTLSSISPLDLINWRVGDSMDYSISLVLGSGTAKKYVTSDEGAALWFTQDIAILGQNQKVEALIQKADGKLLKLKVNGKDQTVPNPHLEIIDQEVTSITVPAGTFDCVHVRAKSDGKKIEVWANPAQTVMDGSLKEVADSGMIGDMTLTLTSFKHGT